MTFDDLSGVPELVYVDVDNELCIAKGPGANGEKLVVNGRIAACNGADPQVTLVNY